MFGGGYPMENANIICECEENVKSYESVDEILKEVEKRKIEENILKEVLLDVTKKYNECKERKIRFNGKVKFKNNLFSSGSEYGVVRNFPVKDKILEVKNGEIELEGIEKCGSYEEKFVEKNYWEDLKRYFDFIEVY